MVSLGLLLSTVERDPITARTAHVRPPTLFDGPNMALLRWACSAFLSC